MTPFRVRIAVAVIVAVALWASVFTVSETDTAIVTLFGRPTRTINAAGVRFKRPLHSGLGFVRQPKTYDPRSSAFPPPNKKNLDLRRAVVQTIVHAPRFVHA